MAKPRLMKAAPQLQQRFGRWIFLKEEKSNAGDLLWKCRCLCGKIGKPTARGVINGLSTQCNSCGTSGPRKRRSKFDIMKNLKLRTRWRDCLKAMIRRCSNPNDSSFKNYGGRGISVHPSFYNPQVFAAHVVTLKGWDDPNLQLDRINNDGNYDPGNLRMATRSQQVLNRRSKKSGVKKLCH